MPGKETCNAYRFQLEARVQILAPFLRWMHCEHVTCRYRWRLVSHTHGQLVADVGLTTPTRANSYCPSVTSLRVPRKTAGLTSLINVAHRSRPRPAASKLLQPHPITQSGPGIQRDSCRSSSDRLPSNHSATSRSRSRFAVSILGFSSFVVPILASLIRKAP